MNEFPTLTGHRPVDAMIGLIIFAVSFIIGYFTSLSLGTGLGIE